MKLQNSIRQATEAEAGVAAQLLRQFNAEYNDPAPSQEQLQARLTELMDDDTIILLAGEPACAIAVLRVRRSIWTPRNECYLAELYVTPEMRGQGVGRALMERVLEAARDAKADYIDLNTAEDDTAARGLYESLGFSRTEGQKDGAINYYYELEL